MENLGFGAANNAGAARLPAEVLLFLNPDTELVDGTLERLVQAIRERPEGGARRGSAGDGRRAAVAVAAPVPVRATCAGRGAWRAKSGPCSASGSASGCSSRSATRGGSFDWTTGAVLAVRREAFEAVGGFDERFFLFSEETDLCKRIQDAGWEAHFEPRIRVVHHAGKAGVHASREAQMAYARLQYARKHFGRPCVGRLPRDPAHPSPAAVRDPAFRRGNAVVERPCLGAGAARVAREEPPPYRRPDALAAPATGTGPS